jgi:hypothetical protein
MENTFYLTLGQAAKETGYSKATIFKAIKSGKLSYVEKTPAGYKIDPAELFRVYPKNAEIVTVNAKSEQSATPENTKENEYLRRENELLRQQLEREQANLDDLKADRDQWRQQATNLLTHQPAAAPVPDQGKLEPDKGSYLSWFARLTRKPTT